MSVIGRAAGKDEDVKSKGWGLGKVNNDSGN